MPLYALGHKSSPPLSSSSSSSPPSPRRCPRDPRRMGLGVGGHHGSIRASGSIKCWSVSVLNATTSLCILPYGPDAPSLSPSLSISLSLPPTRSLPLPVPTFLLALPSLYLSLLSLRPFTFQSMVLLFSLSLLTSTSISLLRQIHTMLPHTREMLHCVSSLFCSFPLYPLFPFPLFPYISPSRYVTLPILNRNAPPPLPICWHYFRSPGPLSFCTFF